MQRKILDDANFEKVVGYETIKDFVLHTEEHDVIENDADLIKMIKLCIDLHENKIKELENG